MRSANLFHAGKMAHSTSTMHDVSEVNSLLWRKTWRKRCQQYMQVSLERSLGNETTLKMAAFMIRTIGSQKTSFNVCRYDFFSLNEFDCFLYAYMLPLEPCFADRPSARPSFTRYKSCKLLFFFISEVLQCNFPHLQPSPHFERTLKCIIVRDNLTNEVSKEIWRTRLFIAFKIKL
jgi:hypothetical protein